MYDFLLLSMKQWDLVCDRGRLSALSQTVMMTGVIFGSFIFGHISDRFGRKRVLTLALLCQGCLGVIEAFSPTFVFFVIIRFFMGILDQVRDHYIMKSNR